MGYPVQPLRAKLSLRRQYNDTAFCPEFSKPGIQDNGTTYSCGLCGSSPVDTTKHSAGNVGRAEAGGGVLVFNFPFAKTFRQRLNLVMDHSASGERRPRLLGRTVERGDAMESGDAESITGQ